MHLLVLLLLAGTLQTPAPPAAANSGYTIGADDLLTITVFGEADLTNKYRVESDGMITFPLVGRIPAAGLTLREVQDRLTTQLASGFIRNPQVRVEVDQYRSQNVFVIGEVRSPGKITMTGSMSLIEALALAGSPTTAASTELVVVHPKKPKAAGAATMPGDDVDAETTRVNIKDLQVGKAGQDVTLHDGDTIYVPKAQIFYITGQVKNPGQYVYDTGMNVQQAMALAGGLTDRGSDRGMKIRRLFNGVEIEIDARLETKIQPNDTIIIRQRFF